ncbi:MRGRH protein, partial [Galbula dea]|nr:MRGRH protein [Galbula dea]
ETTTADISLSYTTSGYTNSWAHNQSWCKKPEHYDTLIISCVSLGISLCGLVGNGIVMWVLIFHMKQNPFTVYVLNLTIADFSLLLILLLFHTLELISFTYCISSLPFILTDYILFILLHFCYFSSMYLLTALSFERCLAAL